MTVRRIVACAALCAAFVLVRPAVAGVLAPGETRHGTNEDHHIYPLPDPSVWQGELLAERTQDYEFTGVTTENEQVAHRGTLTSRVHRDRGTGGLAFVYDFDFVADSPPGLVVDFEEASIRDFGSFATDVYFSRDDFVLRRSADGESLDFQFNIVDVEGTFLVRTDAVAFDGNGSLLVDMDFEGNFDGATDSDTFPTFRPIPEPSAAIAACLTAGVALLRRRSQ